MLLNQLNHIRKCFRAWRPYNDFKFIFFLVLVKNGEFLWWSVGGVAQFRKFILSISSFFANAISFYAQFCYMDSRKRISTFIKFWSIFWVHDEFYKFGLILVKTGDFFSVLGDEVRWVFLNLGNSFFLFPLFLWMQTILRANFVTWTPENEFNIQ